MLLRQGADGTEKETDWLDEMIPFYVLEESSHATFAMV